MMLTVAFAQDTAAQVTPAASNPMVGLMPIAIIFVIFYFLLIRPQKKQQREHEKMLEELAKNDEVVTSGGIHGTIVNVEKQSDVVTMRIAENTRMKIQKSAISKIKKQKSS